MNRENTELRILEITRVVGWLNLLFFSYLLITGKGASGQHSILLLITFTVSVIGTFIYYVFWGKLFFTVEKIKGIKYIKPYRLVVIISIGAVIIINLILYLNV